VKKGIRGLGWVITLFGKNFFLCLKRGQSAKTVKMGCAEHRRARAVKTRNILPHGGGLGAWVGSKK